MAIFTTDLTGELKQIKTAVTEVVDESINPMVRMAIAQAGMEINHAVDKAGEQIQKNINLLSKEIHDQRQLTREDLMLLVDYAAEKIGATVDERINRLKIEGTAFVTERVNHLKQELEDASIKSRRALYTNLALSIGSALLMAAIGIVYKKISLGELDLFAAFRVFLLAAATGTAVFSATKVLQNWLSMNKTKKNAATVLINQISVFRPNGAVGLFVLSIVLLAGWYLASFYNY